jgi:hypothetical protein
MKGLFAFHHTRVNRSDANMNHSSNVFTFFITYQNLVRNLVPRVTSFSSFLLCFVAVPPLTILWIPFFLQANVLACKLASLHRVIPFSQIPLTFPLRLVHPSIIFPPKLPSHNSWQNPSHDSHPCVRACVHKF